MHVALKLFDTMVKPILSFGCQVWGFDFSMLGSKNIHHLDRVPFEQAHNKFSKYVLGVCKLPSNVATRVEPGRYHMPMDIARLNF